MTGGAKTGPDERIRVLEQLIVTYQNSYYNGEAEISDADFDALWDELKVLAPQSPVLARVGADNAEGFPKKAHLIPMGSQDKAANPEEFRAWAEKTAGLPDFGGFLVQYKLDGASLELQYEKGRLVRAVTRGDGVMGDEITPNARRVRGVVEELGASRSGRRREGADRGFSGGVRGEVVMLREVWREKYRDKANCRNAANGLMRRKDGVGSEDLTLITYDAAAADDDGRFKTETEKIAWLKAAGFLVAESREFPGAGDNGEPPDAAAPASLIEDIIAWREEVARKRDDLPFDIDGLVIKDKTADPADLRRARPERQIAFKFELERAFSILRAVEWSESGATYTPIGMVDPVRLAGTTVQRANLNNPGMIRTLGLKIGAAVSVVKRGEIIPKIEGLAPPGALGPEVSGGGERRDIEFPTVCGSCGTPLRDEGTRLLCPNAACPKRLHHRLEKWVGVLDIRELGEKLLRRLFDSGRVRNISDLYTLTAGELAALERMGEKSAARVIRHIRTKRRLPLRVFVAGLDLEGVGELLVERAVSAGYDTLDGLKNAAAAELAGVWGIGTITAETIVSGLRELSGEIEKILEAGIISLAPPPGEAERPLRGLSFCFTGVLRSLKRSAAEEAVKALGGSVKPSVVKDLSYLVTNDPESGSGKNQKARELGIPVIGEEAFLALLENRGKVQGELF
ncbi:MAG: NAD-dependent DNA ligase LigA [Treponema sp.]|jgi:DNA ligase (NAD+)|nr:NAD-dependent DNA ligase LigA [Treponema sp.]